MQRSRFFWKLYAGYVGLILLTSVLIGILVARAITRDELGDMERTLLARTTLLRDIATASLVRHPAEDLQSRLPALGAETGARLTIIRADGHVIADSEADPAEMDNHGNRPEIRQARVTGLGKSTRFSSTVKQEMMYLALPVAKDGTTIGFVRASLPFTTVSERLAEIRDVVVAAAAIAAVAALLIGYIFAGRVTRPLVTMTKAAQSIASGDYDHRMSVDSPDEIGRLARAFNTMVSQLRSRMETIALERNRVLAILGSMVEGVVAVDQRERILFINQVAADLFGEDAAKCLGRPIRDVTQIAIVSETLRGAMRISKETTAEAKIGRGPDRSFLEMQASPLRDSERRLAGAVLVFHDVTQIRRLEAVRRDFVANVSHELKTPVTAIRGLVETLIDDENMEKPTQRNFLDRIKSQSIRLSTLIADLLTISRLESRDEAKSMDLELVDVRDPVRASIRHLRPVVDTKELTLEVDIGDEPMLVVGDIEAMRLISDNLLNNAAKYTPRGGKVWLRLAERNGEIVLEVRDTGIGIKPKHLDRIFERFYRVDKARSRELGGTGLGLSIVRNSALALGGTVSVESRPGSGSTFRVRLPAARSAPLRPAVTE